MNIKRKTWQVNWSCLKIAKLISQKKTSKELTYCISFPKLKVLAILKKLKGYLHSNFYYYFNKWNYGRRLLCIWIECYWSILDNEKMIMKKIQIKIKYNLNK